MAVKIDLAVACSYMQHFQWWGEVFPRLIAEIQNGDIELGGTYISGSAVPDNSKNRTVGAWLGNNRPTLTDANRNQVVGLAANGQVLEDGFMSSSAEWVLWLDDDTVPLKGAVKKMLDLRREFVAGVYFSDGTPPNPIAYVRRDNGFYSPIVNWAFGTLTRVDAVGMGCALVHKEVYRKIMDAHEVFCRPNASLMAVPKSIIHTNGYNLPGDGVQVVNNILHMPLTRPAEDDNRAWPFYALEYGRTEDLHFGELCANAGVQIYLDTSITCEHWKTKAIEYNDYRDYAREHYKTE